jgi:hypothetical protein
MTMRGTVRAAIILVAATMLGACAAYDQTPYYAHGTPVPVPSPPVYVPSYSYYPDYYAPGYYGSPAYYAPRTYSTFGFSFSSGGHRHGRHGHRHHRH